MKLVVRNKTVYDYVMAFVLNLGFTVMGIDTSFAAFFINGQDGLTLTEEELIGSISIYFRIAGSILASQLCYYIGGKNTVQTANIIYFCSWTSILFSYSYRQICLGKIFVGIGAGMQPAALIHLIEVCDSRKRGYLASCQPLFLALGCNISAIIGRYFSWVTVSLVAAIISALEFILLSIIQPDQRCSYSSNPVEVKESKLSKSVKFPEIQKYEPYKFSCLMLALLFFAMPTFIIGMGRIPILNHAEHFFQKFQGDFNSKDLVVVLMLGDTFGALALFVIARKVDGLTVCNVSVVLTSFCLTGIFINDLVLKQIGLNWQLLSVGFMIFYFLVVTSGIQGSSVMVIAELFPTEAISRIVNIQNAIVYVVAAIYSTLLPYLLNNFNVHIIILFLFFNILGCFITFKHLVWELRKTCAEKDGDAEELL